VAAKGLWTLERNPHAPHQARDGPLQRVHFRELRDPAVRLLALRKGDIDLAMAIAIQDLPAVQQDAGLRLLAGPVSAFSNLAMNTAAGPLRSLPLRRAVAQAIDPARYLREGRATPFLGPLPLGMAGAAPDSYTLRFDAAAARAAVLRLGASGARLDMIYPGLSQTADTLAQYLQAVLADAGLAVRLQRLSLPAFIDRVGRGSYDLAMMGWVVDSPDPASIANVWFGADRVGAGGNYARYRDVEVQRLLDLSLVTTDAALRARQIEQAVRLGNAAVPYVYLFQTHNWLVHRARLQGVAFDPWDLYRLRPEQWSWGAA
jgi:peptide/nickel transport system substrate-binding protein